MARTGPAVTAEDCLFASQAYGGAPTLVNKAINRLPRITFFSSMPSRPTPPPPWAAAEDAE